MSVDVAFYLKLGFGREGRGLSLDLGLWGTWFESRSLFWGRGFDSGSWFLGSWV